MNNMLNSSTPTSSQNLAKEAKERLNPKLTKLQKKIKKKINKIKAPYNYDCGANTPCNFGVFNTKFIYDVKSRNSI